jgi:hypothetical protein
LKTTELLHSMSGLSGQTLEPSAALGGTAEAVPSRTIRDRGSRYGLI